MRLKSPLSMNASRLTIIMPGLDLLARATPSSYSRLAAIMAQTLCSRSPSCTLAGTNFERMYLADFQHIRGPRAAENETMAWHFWVRHFRNETQGRRDSKFNYRLADGSVYTGTEPPEGAEPYVMLPSEVLSRDLLMTMVSGSVCTILAVQQSVAVRR